MLFAKPKSSYSGQLNTILPMMNVLIIGSVFWCSQNVQVLPGGRQQPSKRLLRPSPWSSGLRQPAAASCSLGFSMTQFCVKYSFHLQCRILDDTILCQVLLVGKRMAWHIFASSWIGVCNFWGMTHFCVNHDSEYAIPVATKKLADGATYFVS